MSLGKNIGTTALGLSLLHSVSADTGKPLAISEHTPDTYAAVINILVTDLTKMSEGCADDIGGIDQLYTKVIENCLKNYQEGGYLDLDNYKLPFHLFRSGKPRIQDYTNKHWLEHIFKNNPDFSDIFFVDLELINDDNLRELFESVASERSPKDSIKKEHLRAYDLFLMLKKYNFPIRLLALFRGRIKDYIQ